MRIIRWTLGSLSALVALAAIFVWMEWRVDVGPD